ncbi:MAG TPA: hypothetical protein DIU15_05660 [Deltaproteobacteria bacterium]|nr:hypothetical protein [Deltaproteobacteria bacterium]
MPVEALARSLQDYNASARFPLPELDPTSMRRLSQGQLLRLRDPAPTEGGPQRITGLLVCEASRDALWLALRDPHLDAVKDLTEVRLSEEGQWPTVWYQFFHTPGPFADRHWVLSVDDNLALARSSENRLWEHYWTLAAEGPQTAADAVEKGQVPGVDSAMVSKAVYVPFNEGAWLVMALSENRTLLGYTVRASVGGRIPDKLVVNYSLLTLGRVLRRVEARSTTIHSHYDAAHARIRGGDGEPIP